MACRRCAEWDPSVNWSPRPYLSCCCANYSRQGASPGLWVLGGGTLEGSLGPSNPTGKKKRKKKNNFFLCRRRRCNYYSVASARSFFPFKQHGCAVLLCPPFSFFFLSFLSLVSRFTAVKSPTAAQSSPLVPTCSGGGSCGTAGVDRNNGRSRLSLSQVDGDGRRAVRSVQETWAPFHTVDRVADHRLSIIDASALTID